MRDAKYVAMKICIKVKIRIEGTHTTKYLGHGPCWNMSKYHSFFLFPFSFFLFPFSFFLFPFSFFLFPFSFFLSFFFWTFLNLSLNDSTTNYLIIITEPHHFPGTPMTYILSYKSPQMLLTNSKLLRQIFVVLVYIFLISHP
jgi:hypothetical protein